MSELEGLISELVPEIVQEIERANAFWRDSDVPREMRVEQYRFWGAHLLVLVEKARRMLSIWYDTKDEQAMRAEFIKTAAISIRALLEVQYGNLH